MISIDGNTIRLEGPSGHLTVTFDSREVMERLLVRPRKPRAARPHTMYDNGIYGI